MVFQVPLHHVPVRKDPSTGKLRKLTHQQLSDECGVELLPVSLHSRDLVADPLGILSILLVEARNPKS